MWQPQRIYNQFLLRTPAVLVGKESVRGLYNYPCARVAVIHGSSMRDEALYREIFKKKDIRFFRRSWRGEPDIGGLSGTLKELEIYKPDTIIAVGGGSVIDGAKLCRIYLEIPYFKPGITRLDGRMLTTKFLAVPTTIGSGAEVSSSAVYVDIINHRKEMIILHELQPDVVVYDENYVKETPVRILCASALDAAAHLIEGGVSSIDNHIAEIIAETGLGILSNEMKNLLDKQFCEIDYYRLQYAGFLGGIVQNHCIAGAAHAVAHQLTDKGFSHAEAVALLLPAVIRQNMKNGHAGYKYENIAKRAGFENTGSLIDFIAAVCKAGRFDSRRGEMKAVLGSYQYDSSFINNIKNDKSGKGNPAMVTDEYIADLIRGF